MRQTRVGRSDDSRSMPMMTTTTPTKITISPALGAGPIALQMSESELYQHLIFPALEVRMHTITISLHLDFILCQRPLCPLSFPRLVSPTTLPPLRQSTQQCPRSMKYLCPHIILRSGSDLCQSITLIPPHKVPGVSISYSPPVPSYGAPQLVHHHHQDSTFHTQDVPVYHPFDSPSVVYRPGNSFVETSDIFFNKKRHPPRRNHKKFPYRKHVSRPSRPSILQPNTASVTPGTTFHFVEDIEEWVYDIHCIFFRKILIISKFFILHQKSSSYPSENLLFSNNSYFCIFPTQPLLTLSEEYSTMY